MKKGYILLICCILFASCNAQQQKLCGSWSLQEVQIPLGQEFSEWTNYDNPRDVDISDKSFTVWDVDDYKVIERWDYSINNDSILTLSNGAMYHNYVIKKLTKDELVLADEYALSGYTILRYVPSEKRPYSVKHTKHSLTLLKPEIDYNPIVKRLDDMDIKRSDTPSAVAYNFVVAIYNSDTKKMLSYMTTETKLQWDNMRKSDGYDDFDPYFSESNDNLNIKGWTPAIDSGNYEIAVLFVQDVGYDEFGRICKKVYVACVPSSEVNIMGFQDITRYDEDTNVKVLVVNEDGGWKVIGFK